MSKAAKVDPKILKIPFYVRTQLNPDHVLKLADLYLAGVAIPPIEITSSNEIIEGRHRREAWELAFPGKPMDVIYIDDTDKITLLGRALTANEGGPLQPSRADIIHTIRLMLLEKATERQIYELLPYPRAATRKYLAQAKEKLHKGLVQLAKEDVAENGLTVKEAAVKHGIDPAELKKAISPKMGVNSGQLSNILKDVTNRYYSLTRANQALVKRMVLGYVDGDVQEKSVRSVIDKIEALISSQARHVKDWKNRFEAAEKGQLLNWKDVSSPKDKDSEES